MDILPSARPNAALGVRGSRHARADYRVPGWEDLSDDENRLQPGTDGGSVWQFQRIYLPFAEKSLLYEMIHRDWRCGELMLSGEPNKSTYYTVLRRPQLRRQLCFLKQVILGRCPVCSYYKNLISKALGRRRVRQLLSRIPEQIIFKLVSSASLIVSDYHQYHALTMLLEVT